MQRTSRWRSIARTCAEWTVPLSVLALAATQGDRIWRAAAPGWPGGGYGFAATLGFVFVTGWVAVMQSYSAVRTGRHPDRTGWLSALTVLAFPIAALSTVALVALLPGRNGRLLGSLGQENPTWVEEHLQVCWAIPAGLAAGGLLVAALVRPRPTGRRRREGGER